jgi:hypothetical protein
VSHYTPYLHTDKFGILQDGERCSEYLGLDFDEIYSRTNTSYKPIWIPKAQTLNGDVVIHESKEGQWFSDYKSAASVERIESFIKLGRPDPVAYADLELGPVSWEHVVKHVKIVLENHNK